MPIAYIILFGIVTRIGRVLENMAVRIRKNPTMHDFFAGVEMMLAAGFQEMGETLETTRDQL